MNKYLWVLLAFLIEIMLEAGFHIASAASGGLSVKNFLIYGLFVIYLFRRLYGQRGLISSNVSAMERLFIFYTVTCLLFFIIINFLSPVGSSWKEGIVSIKSGLFDPTIVMFLFFYFPDTLKRSKNMVAFTAIIVGCFALLSCADVLLSSVSLFGFDGDSNRPNGAFGEPNQTAAVMAMFFPVILAQILSKQKLWLVFFPSAVLILFFVASSGSRGGLLGLIIGSLFFIWFVRKQLSIEKKVLILLAVPMMLAIAWLLVPVYYQELFLSRLSFLGNDTIDLSEASAGRTDIWAYVISQWLQRPMLGWGWGGYQTFTGHMTHNIYLERLVDTGIIGFLIWLLVQLKIWFFVYNPMRQSRGNARLQLAGMAAGLLSYFVVILFVNLTVPAMIVWAYIGLMLSYSNQVRLQLAIRKRKSSEIIPKR